MSKTGQFIDSAFTKPTRRLSDFMTGLSSRSLNSTNSISVKPGKKQVQFSSDLEVTHEYPAANATVSNSELWYSVEYLHNKMWKDVDTLLFEAEYLASVGSLPSNSSDPIEKRGLEFYIEDLNTKRSSMQRYMDMVVFMSKQLLKNKKLFRTAEKCIARFSVQATAAARKAAYRRAKEDEAEAVSAYLSDSGMQKTTNVDIPLNSITWTTEGPCYVAALVA